VTAHQIEIIRNFAEVRASEGLMLLAAAVTESSKTHGDAHPDTQELSKTFGAMAFRDELVWLAERRVSYDLFIDAPPHGVAGIFQIADLIVATEFKLRFG
jgi:hypothetical protein